jgi:hypothetical protein
MAFFIIHGTASKILKEFHEFDSACEYCGSPTISYFIWQKYYHFFWIPFFPVKKIVGIYCPKCKQNNDNVFSPTGALLKKEVKTPVFMYSWVIIIIILLSSILVRSYF